MNLSLHTVPYVCVCCDQTSDNRLNHLQKRGYRTYYNYNVASYEWLLGKDNSVTIQVRNLRILATQLYKTKENLAAPTRCEIFEGRISNITFAHKLNFN